MAKSTIILSLQFRNQICKHMINFMNKNLLLQEHVLRFTSAFFSSSLLHLCELFVTLSLIAELIASRSNILISVPPAFKCECFPNAFKLVNAFKLKAFQLQNDHSCKNSDAGKVGFTRRRDLLKSIIQIIITFKITWKFKMQQSVFYDLYKLWLEWFLHRDAASVHSDF